MFLVISLCQTDSEDGQIVYTSPLAVFNYENGANEFCEGKDHLFIINTDNAKLVKDASVTIKTD